MKKNQPLQEVSARLGELEDMLAQHFRAYLTFAAG
jgi:hypothetical protein